MCFAEDFSFPIKYQEKVKHKMNYPSNDDSQFLLNVSVQKDFQQ